jgi:hypothetical protein
VTANFDFLAAHSVPLNVSSINLIISPSNDSHHNVKLAFDFTILSLPYHLFHSGTEYKKETRVEEKTKFQIP